MGSAILQTQNQYMNIWLPKRAAYLQRIITAEGINSNTCICCWKAAHWQCHSCLGQPMFCWACCCTDHQLLIFHQIEKWNGKFFQDAWLWEVRARLHVGHQGLECPSQTIPLNACKINEQNKNEHNQLSVAQYNFGLVPVESQLPQPPPIYIPDLPLPNPGHSAETNDQDDLNWEDVPSHSFVWVPLQTPTPMLNEHDNEFLLIVDLTALLSLPVILCSCSNATLADELLLDLELLPASYGSVKTAFTFCCLSDYRSSNLECKTSAYQYYQKLRWLTNPTFPQAVPNRYNEFCWATWQCSSSENGSALATAPTIQVKDPWHCFALHALSPISICLPIFSPDTQLLTLVLIDYSLIIFLRTETMQSLVADGNFMQYFALSCQI